MENCIILTGGGTAGHTTLNINLQDELKKYFTKIVYIGSVNGIEKELVKNKTSYEYKSISTVKLDRKKILKNLKIPFLLSKSISEAKKIINEVKPSIIFSKGGYVGLPVAIAGKKLGIPVICHESDLTMGLANKISKKYSKIICTNFEKTALKNGKKCIHTGMPISLSKFSKEEAKTKLNISTSKPILLVTGGSLGAKSLNEFIFNNYEKLTEKFFIIHLTGKNNSNNIKSDYYKQIEFSNDMPTIFRASDYAISRAGANTCIELLSNNILTIFIPLPKSNSRGDQLENAKYLTEKNTCRMIQQKNLNLENILNELNFLQKNAKLIKNNIKNMKICNGTRKIIELILNNKKLND